MIEQKIYERFRDRYTQGQVPWDHTLPPPEVMALAAALMAGRALDLGCGLGRAAIYLAQHGWRVDGVDFVPEAIVEARQRAAAAGVAEQICFFTASVAELGFLAASYDLALDVGCLHALTDEQQRAYSRELGRLLLPGGSYLLFARLLSADGELAEDGPRGMLETAVTDLFRANFRLERAEHGQTVMPDGSAWLSAWFWFRRL